MKQENTEKKIGTALWAARAGGAQAQSDVGHWRRSSPTQRVLRASFKKRKDGQVKAQALNNCFHAATGTSAP